MTEMYKRRIRIQSKPDNFTGHTVEILDAETGEHIPHVASVRIYLNPTDLNRAKITYYKADENGNLVVKDGKPVRRVAIAENPEVDLMAVEVEGRS